MAQTTLIPKKRQFLEGIKTSQKSFATTQTTITNLSKLLKERKEKREKISSAILTEKRKREYLTLRQESEDELEAKRVVSNPNILSSLGSVAANTGGSFIDRIVNTMGYLAAGWLIRNLPTWEGMAKEFIARLQEAGRIIGSFVTDAIRVFQSSYNLITGAIQNLKNFDLTDSSGNIRTSFDELVDSINDMGSELEAGIKLITTPLTQTAADGSQVGTYSGEEVPGLGSTSTDMGAYEESAPSSSGSAVSGAYDIAAKIGANRQQWDIYRNTLAQIESGGRYDVPGGSGKHYDGRYQMGAAAKKDAARILGIPYPGHSDDPNHPSRVAFRKNPELQEKMFAAYTLANHGYLSSNSKYQGKETVEQKLQILGYAHNQGAGGAAKWLNTGIVGRDGFNTKGTKYSDSLARNFKSKVNPYPNSYSPTQSSNSNKSNVQPKTPIAIGKIPDISVGERAGYSSSRGRIHAGRDIAAPSGTGLTVPSDSVIISKGFEGGYGNYVILRASKGIEHMYGHMLEQSPFKKGDVIRRGQIIGRVGSTGRSTGPHLHWEISPRPGEVGFSRKNIIDPIEYGYSSQIPFTSKVSSQQLLSQKSTSTSAPPPADVKITPQPAQISPTPTQQSRQQMAQALVPDNKPQDIVAIIPEHQMSPQMPQPSGAPSGGASPSVSMGMLLNNFMKQKLLLDLSYV